MSMGELLLTALVALIVIKPKHLPMFVHVISKIIKHIQQFKMLLQNKWNELELESQLKINEEKAKAADALYSENNSK